MRINPRKYGPERRALLAPLAHKHGLDYDQETLFPGARPAQTAFHLVGCGADLLSGLRYPDAIPTTNRKLAKSTAKAVARRFRQDEGRHAAVFLTQAFAAWYVELMSRDGDAKSAAIHRKLRDLIQQFFPLGPADNERLESLRAEYCVMDDHDMTGRMPVTGYHTALIDPSHMEGDDVDDDQQLVEAQERYASRYLRLLAEHRAIELCIGELEFGSIEGELLRPSWAGYEILEYDQGNLSWWTNVAADWQRYGELALGLEQPAPSPLRHQRSADLLTKAMELVEAPDAPMPETSQRAAVTFSSELGGDALADRDLAMDALIIGYRIRQAETLLWNYNHLDPETRGRYNELQEREPGLGVTSAGAALEIAASMPAAFSGPDEVWEELRAWAVDHALQRAWQRHALGRSSACSQPG